MTRRNRSEDGVFVAGCPTSINDTYPLATAASGTQLGDRKPGNKVNEIYEITREARLYSLKELARRAGASADFFRSWRIEFDRDATTIYVNPGTAKRIRIRNAPSKFWRELSAGTFRTTRASWFYPPLEPISTLIPNFIIPFSCESQNASPPLFGTVEHECVESAFDILVPTLLSLSRWEETREGQRDEHGRFTASMSVASRDRFLKQPIVDEYGLALEQALTYLLPAWRPAERKLRVKVSHDIDVIGIPFNARSTIGHTLRRHKPLATARDLLGGLVGLNPTFLETVRQVVQPCIERDLDSAVYWKASPPGPKDSGYDPRHPKVRRIISWLREHGAENGVHPGYRTFLEPDRLRQEMQALQEVLGEWPLGGRQHYLRWRPDTWLHWEACGLAYDSSVGYHDLVGFRAGTCFPYRPWLLTLNREANLIEIPLVAMEQALWRHMHLTPEQSLEALSDCVTRCRLVGGVFTFLWHNIHLLDPIYGDFYEQVLDTLVGAEKFEWKAPAANFY